MASGARWLAGVGLVVAAVVAGCGGDEEPAPEVSVDLYFTSGEQFHKVTRELAAEGSEVEMATEALLAGPTEAERTAKVPAQTTIPDGVELLDASLDDGVAHVGLSERFLAGVPGDSGDRAREQQATLDARIGQLTYTLNQFEGVRAVAIRAGDLTVARAERPADYAKPEQGPPLFRARHEGKPKQGAKVPGTRKVQKRLAHLRYLPHSAVDGVAGYRTQQAVMAFQAWSGLERDGIVGPATTAALAAAHRPRPGPQGSVAADRGLSGQGRRAADRARPAAPGDPRLGRGAGQRRRRRAGTRSFARSCGRGRCRFRCGCRCASYFNQGIAFHEYADVPPYPASHGCVRVPAPEAHGVYDFATIGTAVVVY